MAIPVVASFNTALAGGLTATSVTVNKPSGVAVGDLLVLLVGNEDNTATTSFAAITGWTKAYEFGDATPDTKIGMYWRIADGTEGASETIDWNATGADAGGAWYLRITGADTTNPIHLLGTSSQTVGATSQAAPSITTTNPNCLVFGHHSFDGGDGTRGVSGTGWPSSFPANQELYDTIATTAWSGGWVTKDLASAGASQDVTFSSDVSDGMVQVQFAVNELQFGIASVTPSEFDYDATSVVAAGTNFGSTQSTGTIYISDASTLAGSANEVDVSSAVTAWNDTSITLNLTNLSAGELASLQTLGPGARFLIVLTAASDEYSSAVTAHRPQGFQMVLGAATPGTTTARLTGMSGTFGGGRIEETAAQNPSTTTTDVAANGNREDVWSIQAKPLSREVSYDFRVLYDGNVADTITQTPQVTVSGTVDHATTGVLTGAGSAVVGTAAHIAIHATSSVLTGAGSVIAGTAARFRALDTSGVLTGEGSVVAGTASSATERSTVGVLTGQDSVVVGAAARFRAFDTSGVLTGAGATIVGTAARTRVHATSGDLLGQGSAVAGTAAHIALHDTSGDLVAGAAIIAGTSARTRVHGTAGDLAAGTAAIVGAASRATGAVTHDTDGVLAGQGAVVAGTAARLRAFATSGVLTGAGSSVVGTAARLRAFATSGVLTGAGSSVVGTAAHIAIHATSGDLLGQGSEIVGAAARAGAAPNHVTDGVLTGQGATVASTATRFRAFATSGVLTGQGSAVVGIADSAADRASSGVLLGQGATVASTATRFRAFATSGVLTGQGSAVAGTAARAGAPPNHVNTGALTGQGAAIAGTAAHVAIHTTTGVLTGQGSAVAGTAARVHLFDAAGSLLGAGTVLAGAAGRTRVHVASGGLVGQGSVLSASSSRYRGGVASGVLVGQGSFLAGAADRLTLHVASGVLVGQGSFLAGAAVHLTLHVASGTLAGQGAALAGQASITPLSPPEVYVASGAWIAGRGSRKSSWGR